MIYLDTSFVVSLYSVDANSAAAAVALQTSESPLLMSSLTETETVNALGLREFRKEISRAEANGSLRDFEEDLRRGAFLRSAFPESVFQRARTLSLQSTARLGLRTADLLHVAVALELGSKALFTFDLRQRKLCSELGLAVNPLP
ncbi:MAG: type II toxin-antitoxin system VapC family toxin [Terracidiphilus sp.]